MAIDLKDNKGNTYNIGLINNTAQANTDINANLDISSSDCVEIKTGLLELVKTYFSNKTFRYIGESKYNYAKYNYELQQRIDNIPNEHITKPRLSIVGPVVESLRYNIDEEQIREMFTNLLLSEIDTRKKQAVLPAYIHIIQELSMDDAKFLIVLKKNKKKAFSVMTIRNTEINSIWGRNIDKFIVVDKNRKIQLNETVINNLERLGIIKISELNKLKDCDENCENLFNLLKDDYIIDENRKLSYSTSTLDITDFGWNFIDICCS